MEDAIILNYFTLLSGLNPQEAAGWEPLCRACAEELRAGLRPSVEEADHRERLNLAAAALANYRYGVLKGDGVEAFRIGEVSCSGIDDQLAKRELFQMVADLLDTEGTALRSVVIR